SRWPNGQRLDSCGHELHSESSNGGKGYASGSSARSPSGELSALVFLSRGQRRDGGCGRCNLAAVPRGGCRRSRNPYLRTDAARRFEPSLPRSVGFLPVSSPLLPVRRPLRCPATATSSQCPYSGHIPANRVSRVWKKSLLWSISGNAHGLQNRSRTRVGAFSTGILSSGHTRFH